MSEYPNWATEEMAMVMFNDAECMEELEDVYNKGWLNEMRLSKEIRQLQYVDEEVSIRFLLWEVFMHFDNMHEKEIPFTIRWAEGCQPVESTSVDNRKIHPRNKREPVPEHEMMWGEAGIGKAHIVDKVWDNYHKRYVESKSCAVLGAEIHGHLERAEQHFSNYADNLTPTGEREMAPGQQEGCVASVRRNQTRPLFEMVPTYNGIILTEHSDEHIFDQIREIDNQIKHIDSLVKVSKKAKEAAKLMEADKASLIEYVDNR